MAHLMQMCLVNDSISRELLLCGAESSHVKWHQKTLFWTSMSDFFQNLHIASTLDTVHRRKRMILKSLDSETALFCLGVLSF